MSKENILRELIGNRTQKEFALKHGKGEVQVSEWMTNKRHISNTTLEKIAKIEGYKLTITLKLEKL
jgi:transcriptional regulator with XRE-family HTH domain